MTHAMSQRVLMVEVRVVLRWVAPPMRAPLVGVRFGYTHSQKHMSTDA